jgi:hypothetical protein
LWFERYAYDFASKSLWYSGSFEARLERTPATGEYPSSADFWVGHVRDAAAQLVGVLTVGWISPFLRKATLQVDFEEGAVVPQDNGQGIDWDFIFRQLGWQLSLETSSSPVPLPDTGTWTGETLHQTMLAFRRFNDLDTEFRFHVLCVKELDFPGDPGGAMYDRADFDTNGIPREGFAIASDFVYPNQPEFGRVAGQRAGDVPEVLFRTMAHEFGHALGLSHAIGPSGAGRSFMSPTQAVANNGNDGNPFPDNIIYSYSETDRLRLQHGPDILIRPGGTYRAGQFSYGSDPAAPVAVGLSSS